MIKRASFKFEVSPRAVDRRFPIFLVTDHGLHRIADAATWQEAQNFVARIGAAIDDAVKVSDGF